MIHFNVPPYVGTELDYMRRATENRKICGDGPFTKECNKWLENHLRTFRVMLTTSGSSALNIGALLCNIKHGDEVILPSFTFPSTANAFVMCGAKLVFVDIRPDTMNIDEQLIEQAITDKTRAICVVHYAGVSCDMDSIMNIARKYNLMVVEDAAQAIMSSYKGKALGTIGDFGCFSFHETKNFSMGEGGAIAINDQSYIEKAEIIREKGTNRSKFYRGEVDKYNWVDYGDSYLPSDLNAAYLLAQSDIANEINENRLSTWQTYYDNLKDLENKGIISLPCIPDGCVHNAHMFYIKCINQDVRNLYIDYMLQNDIKCVFHYLPLHSAPAGKKFGHFFGEDKYTTSESEKLVRLPLYYGIEKNDLEKVIEKTRSFFGKL